MNLSTQPVLVVLLGWTGACHKHLDKYADIWLKQGCHILQYCAKSQNFMPSGARREAQRIGAIVLRCLQASDPAHRPKLVLQAFSNGGLTPMIPLLEAIDDPANDLRRDDLLGIIMDSCPIEFTRDGGLMPVYTNLTHNKPQWFKWAAWMLLYPIFSMCAFWAQITPPFDIERRYRVPVLWTTEWLRHIPFLYLYSASDPFTNASYVEEVIAQQRAFGMDVRALRWETSGHVRHLQTHEGEYKAACAAFLHQAASA
ncbi:MAG: DUF829 domain-containing protein [Myxococcota bacterium]